MLKYSSKVLVQIVSCEVKIRTQVSLSASKAQALSIRSAEDESKGVPGREDSISKGGEAGDRGGTARKGSGHRLKHRAPAREQRWEVRVRMERQELRRGMKSITDWRGTGGQGSLKQGHPQNWI